MTPAPSMPAFVQLKGSTFDFPDVTLGDVINREGLSREKFL
jgi:hypothetical protein